VNPFVLPEFFWQPIPDPDGDGGTRHIFRGNCKQYQEGEKCSTLCLVQVSYTEHGDWLRFPSCMKCWDLAKQLQNQPTP
jgi:hypothetical protein